MKTNLLHLIFIDIDSREAGFFSSDFTYTGMTHPEFSQSQGIKFISLHVLINGARSRPDRVVDILEACGALDLSSSLSRDVIFISEMPFTFFFALSLYPFFLLNTLFL